MSKDLYFKRTDNDVAFSSDIIKAHYLMTGIKIDYDNYDEIRKVAASMAGIERELKRPSPAILVKHGYVISAIKVYRDFHDCSLSEAKHIIDKMVEVFKEELEDVQILSIVQRSNQLHRQLHCLSRRRAQRESRST